MPHLPSFLHAFAHPLPRGARRVSRRWPLCAGAVVALAACSHQPAAPQLDAARVQKFEAAGYPAAAPVAVDEASDVVLVQGLPARLTWRWPRRAGAHPVVMCMPGLGQSAQALDGLRQALAEAGYVVVSWQPLGDDEAPIHGDPWVQAARYGSKALQARVDRTVALLRAWHSGALSGPWAGSGVEADLGHMAVLGYELGAQTAQALAGEQVAGVSRPADTSALLQGVQAWVWISPHASFAQGGLDTRFKPVTRPVMVLTSDTDRDSTAVVGAPYLRTAAYAGLGTPDKAMLLLRSASHGELGERAAQDPLSGRQEAPAPGDREARARQGGRGASGSGGPGGAPGGPGGMSGDGPGLADSAAAQASPTTAAMHRLAMRDGVVAFLDAHLRQDAVARNWLQGPVQRWVAPVGEWLPSR